MLFVICNKGGSFVLLPRIFMVFLVWGVFSAAHFSSSGGQMALFLTKPLQTNTNTSYFNFNDDDGNVAQ